jgi:hypothetical protein
MLSLGWGLPLAEHVSTRAWRAASKEEQSSTNISWREVYVAIIEKKN